MFIDSTFLLFLTADHRVFYVPSKYYLSTYLPTSLPTYLPIYLSIYLPTYLPACLSTYLSIYLSIRPSTYLSIYRAFYLSTSLPLFVEMQIIMTVGNRCKWKSILSFLQIQFFIISLQSWTREENIAWYKDEKVKEERNRFCFLSRVTSPRSCENLEWHGPWRNFAYDARRFLRIGRYVSTRRRRG